MNDKEKREIHEKFKSYFRPMEIAKSDDLSAIKPKKFDAVTFLVKAAKAGEVVNRERQKNDPHSAKLSW